MEYINKTVFLNYLSCPTLGWKTKRGMFPKLSGLNNELLTLEGRNIHKEALKLFPGIVSGKDLKLENSNLSAEELIVNLDVNQSVSAMSFVAGGFYAKPDILKKLEDNSWHLFEVKSGSRYKVKYTNDISFNVMVLSKLGIRVSKTSVLYLSSGYRLGMGSADLFTEVDCSEKLELKVQEFVSVADKVLKEVECETMPTPIFLRASFIITLAFILAVVLISPPTISTPLEINVSHATLAFVSCFNIASSILSDTISHTLSGCPSVTDSDVK